MDKLKKEMDSAEKTKQKRERNVNFTVEETELLVALAEAKIHIIENKKSDAATWQCKEIAWKTIETEFNSLSTIVYRDHKHLKLKYEALKRDLRRKSALVKAESESGSGTVSSRLSPLDQRVRNMLRMSVEGSDSYDSDYVMPEAHMLCNVVIESRNQEIETPAPKLFLPPREEPKVVQPPRMLDTTIEIEPLNHQPGSDPTEGTNQPTEGSSSTPRPRKHVLMGQVKERRPFYQLIKEKIKIAQLQRQIKTEELHHKAIKRKILTEELEQKIIQRKYLEQELEHKKCINDLEKEHSLLKIELLKKFRRKHK
ncbi:uncharacterized protein LOC142976478 [Anticarsia gemmatalis]|uniref:uncharacterized protein LOC142976478 n=1 Tax=Anticarsia gemmatalis TaxID=129554 RepID=UPI003F75EEEA